MAYAYARKIIFKDGGKRVETGAICFNDDWNGLFIRGDDCIQVKFVLEKMLADSVCLFLLHPAEANYIKMLLEEINENVLMKPKE